MIINKVQELVFSQVSLLIREKKRLIEQLLVSVTLSAVTSGINPKCISPTSKEGWLAETVKMSLEQCCRAIRAGVCAPK